MLFSVVDVAIKLVAYSLIIYSLWMLVGAPFLSVELTQSVQKYKRQRRVKRIQELAMQKAQTDSKAHSAWYRHLELILSSVKRNSDEPGVFNFMVFCLTLFGVSSVLLMISIHDPGLSLLISLLLAVLPYFFVRMKLIAIRGRTSLLFLNYFPVVLQNYQSANRDIYFALTQSIPQIKNNEMQRLFMKLLNAMQLQRSRVDFEKTIHVFVYSVNSTFAKRFGKLLIRAHLERSDISESFSQLDADIRKRKADMELEKTKNFDTVNLGFLPIVTIPFAFYFAHYLSGVLDFWYFFRLKTNLTLFIITVVAGILCVSISFLLRKPKADL